MGNMAPLFLLSYPKGTDYALNERSKLPPDSCGLGCAYLGDFSNSGGYADSDALNYHFSLHFRLPGVI